ncbi:MAG: hypothetical protein AAFQ79_16775 [Pseudomonadota bacterium]
MAELKRALETEQAQAIEVADRALSAIGTITAISGVAIGVLGLLMAILGLIGYARIKASAKDAAELVAEKHLRSYIQSEEFGRLFERKVAEEAQKRWQNTVVLREFTAPEKPPSEASPFPEKKET